MKTVDKSLRKGVLLHCSDTPLNIDFTIETLRRTHVDYNGWSDIGYNFYITKDGTIYKCRPLNVSGAHEKKCNISHFSICFEGGYKPVPLQNGKLPNNWRDNAEKWDKPTNEQLKAVIDVFVEINEYMGWEDLKVECHYEYSDHKTCPNFAIEDFKTWL